MEDEEINGRDSGLKDVLAELNFKAQLSAFSVPLPSALPFPGVSTANGVSQPLPLTVVSCGDVCLVRVEVTSYARQVCDT